MSITTIDGALAGMQPPNWITKAITPTLVAGRPQSLWGLGGNPGAGAFNTTLNGVALTAPVNGQVPFVNPASGNAYLSRLQGQASIAGLLLLCDRLWHNGGYTITSTSAQNTTHPGLPSRDADGAALGTGVLAGVEVSGATGAGTPTLTVGYTNQANASGRSATNIIATVASSAAGAFYPIGLQAGDLGMRSIQSLTLSATWTSGTINLVMYRVLAALELTAANTPNGLDAITGGFPRLFNGSVPFFIFIPSTTTASVISGLVGYAHG